MSSLGLKMQLAFHYLFGRIRSLCSWNYISSQYVVWLDGFEKVSGFENTLYFNLGGLGTMPYWTQFQVQDLELHQRLLLKSLDGGYWIPITTLISFPIFNFISNISASLLHLSLSLSHKRSPSPTNARLTSGLQDPYCSSQVVDLICHMASTTSLFILYSKNLMVQFTPHHHHP